MQEDSQKCWIWTVLLGWCRFDWVPCSFISYGQCFNFQIFGQCFSERLAFLYWTVSKSMKWLCACTRYSSPAIWMTEEDPSILTLFHFVKVDSVRVFVVRPGEIFNCCCRGMSAVYISGWLSLYFKKDFVLLMIQSGRVISCPLTNATFRFFIRWGESAKNDSSFWEDSEEHWWGIRLIVFIIHRSDRPIRADWPKGPLRSASTCCASPAPAVPPLHGNYYL